MSRENAARSRAERANAARAEQARRERNRRIVLIGSVVLGLLIVVVGAFVVQSQRTTVGQPGRVPSGLTDGYGVVVGKASAPTTLTVYEDFQCPICRDFEQETRDQLRAAVAAGRVRIDYRMVSFLDRASTNEYSSRALNAAAVVLDTSGKDVFAEFHRALFEDQPEEGTAGPTNDELVDAAVAAGAQESDVRAGIEDGEFAQWAANAQAQMSEAGVTGTPTLFVDGEKAGDTLQDSIDAALEAAG